MNKKFLSMAAAAMMFAACSDDLKVDQAPEIATNPTEATAEQVPVMFGAYVNRATTRAGLSGTLSSGVVNWDATNNEWKGIEKSGFGVFAYYTNNDLYNENFKPNFMYNTRVYNNNSDGTAVSWVYEPVRYWPNEFGIGAVSDDVDRVSFFAYAPFVSFNTSGGLNGTGVTYDEDKSGITTGIIGATRNSWEGDPMIKYAVSWDATKAVDLTYGLAAEPITTATGEVNAQSPMVDLTKPSTEQKLKFEFHHALAQLNVQIDAAVDGLDAGKQLGTMPDGITVENSGSTKTHIYVRSITFEGLADKGMLNLRTGGWYDMTGLNAVSTSDPIVLHDGRGDGREAIMEATNEGISVLNPVLIQKGAITPAGVTKDPVNLFKVDETLSATDQLAQSIMVIPTGQDVQVTIVYDVETEDANLPEYLSGSSTHGISIQNAITQTVPLRLNAGKKHVLKLHLGMNSVKFDAEVKAWDDTTPAEQKSDLPGNVSGTLNQLKQRITAIETNAGLDDDAKNTQLAALSPLFVGKYIDKDGNISSSTTANTIGIIAQLALQASDLDKSSAFPSAARILVISSADATLNNDGITNTFNWLAATPNVFLDATHANDDYVEYDSSKKTATDFPAAHMGNLKGYEVTQTFKDNTNAQAIYTAAKYNVDLTALTGNSGWFLPTIGQMINMGAKSGIWETGNPNAMAPTGAISMLPSGLYWTASELSANGAWRYGVNGASSYWNANNKTTSTFHVRPVFAY